MNKINKLSIGFFSTYPIIFFLVIFLILIVPSRYLAYTRFNPQWLDFIGPFAIMFFIPTFFIWLFYLIKMFKNERVKDSYKVQLWISGLLIFPILVMPLYWYSNVWKEGEVK